MLNFPLFRSNNGFYCYPLPSESIEPSLLVKHWLSGFRNSYVLQSKQKDKIFIQIKPFDRKKSRNRN